VHLLGGLQLLGLLADVPDADLVVLAAGDHVVAVAGDGETGDATVVLLPGLVRIIYNPE